MIVRALIALAILALPAMAGDVTGQVLITKRLTRKVVSPTVYALRGTPTPSAPAEGALASEFDRIIVMLEGGNLLPAAAQTVTMKQRNGRFEPELVAGAEIRSGVLSQISIPFRHIHPRRHCSSLLPYPRQHVCGDCRHCQSLVRQAIGGRWLFLERCSGRSLSRRCLAQSCGNLHVQCRCS